MNSWLNKYFIKRRLKKKFPKVVFGSNIWIEDIELIDNLTFSDYAYIGSDAIWSLRGKLIIGNNVIFGPRSILWPYNHNYESMNYIPYGYKQEDVIKSIIIKDNVWFGMNVTLLAGVTIEEGAIIAAHAVVTKNVPKGAIVAGNPAKIIKYRNIEKYDVLKKKGKFYLEFKYKR